MADRPDTPADDWQAVVVEVRQCGLNQAKHAVEIAKLQGATPDDVRAILLEWRTRRVGWQYAPQNHYRRLLQFDPQQSPSDGWSPFDPDYQARLDRDAAAAEAHAHNRAAWRRQLAARRARRRSRYQTEVESVYGRTFAELIAEAFPALAEGVAAARNRREIEARQFERQRDIRREIENADGAEREAILAERQTARRLRVDELTAQFDLHEPRPP